MSDDDVGHLHRHRHEIIGERAVHELTGVAVTAFLEQCRAQPLHDAAAELFVHEHRIDDAATILDDEMLQELNEASLDIHLQRAALDAVGESERIALRREVMAHGELRLRARRQRIGAEIGDACDFGDRQARVPRACIDDLAIEDIERRWLLLQNERGNLQDVALERARGLQRGLAADAGAAAGPGRAAMRRHLGISGDDLDTLLREAQLIGHDLADDRLGALPLLGDRDQAAHLARGRQAQDRAVLRRDARTADAIERRAGIGDLDEGRDADAAIDAALAQVGLLGTKCVIAHHFVQALQAGLMRQRLEAVAGRRGLRIGIVGDDVLRPDGKGIETELACCHVDETLGHRAGDGMADGAVLAGLHLVLEDHLQRGSVIFEAIGRADQADDLIALDDAGARIGRERPDRGQVQNIHRQDLALGIQRHPGADAMVAGVDVRDEGLHPVGDVFHGPAEQDRETDHRHVLVIDMQLHAEGAADVGRDDADAGFRNVVVARIEVLKLIRGLRAVMHGEHARGWIVVGDDGARLQRHRGVAAEGKLLLHHMGRMRKGVINDAAVELAAEAGVVGTARIDQRTVRLTCAVDVNDDGKVLVVHLDQLQRIFSNRPALGNDGDHRLSGPDHAIERQRQLRRGGHALEMIERAGPGRADFCEISARGDEMYAL
nr:hypothetical protein [Bradyrhizobium sp. CIR48]